MNRAIVHNKSGIAPLLALAIIAVVGTVGAIGVYNYTKQPDVTQTFNITETGFSLAGVSIDSMAIIGIAIAIVFIVILVAMRRKSSA